MEHALESGINSKAGFTFLALAMILAVAAVVAAVAVMSLGKGASLFVPVTLVCEWKSDRLVHEPLNLLSSAVIFLAAGLLWRDYRRTRKAFDEERLTLIALLVLIGAGSVAFHADANRLTF